MVLFCGEALIDMVPEQVDGRAVYAPCYGGSPYNTAIAAARILGDDDDAKRAAFLSRLSDDFFGEELFANLEKNKVDTKLVARSGRDTGTEAETTTLAFVKLSGGAASYIFYTTGAADRSLRASDIPAALPREVSCIAFGSISLLLEPTASTIENFVFRESARAAGPVISLDPNVRPMLIADRAAYGRRFAAWLHASTILKLSDADLDCLYPGASSEKMIEQFFAESESLRLVFVTLGGDGVIAAHKNSSGKIMMMKEAAWKPASGSLAVVDTIGAGDTFHGALLSHFEMKGLLSREKIAALAESELREAVAFASKAAAIVCTRKGANPPTLAEVEKFCRTGAQ